MFDLTPEGLDRFPVGEIDLEKFFGKTGYVQVVGAVVSDDAFAVDVIAHGIEV